MLVFALGAALPLLLLAGGAVWQQNRAERLRVEEGLIGHAQAMALLLDREFAGAERMLQALAGSPALAHGDLPTFWAEMRSASAAFGARAINLVGPDGRIRLSTSWSPGDRAGTMSIGPAVEALAGGRTVIGNLFISPSVGEWSVGIAMPVLVPDPEQDAPVRQALGLVLPRERLLSALIEQRLPPGAVAAALDRDLTIVARTARDRDTVASRPPGEVLSALAPQSGVVPPYTAPEGDRVVAAQALAPQSGFRVVVSIPEAAFAASLRQALLPTMLVGAALLSMALVFGALFAGRLSRSLRRLGEPGMDGLPRRHPVREFDELGALLARRAEAREAAAAEARALFDNSPVGVVRADAGGRVTAANDAFLHIVGMTREDLAAGRIRWDDLTPPEWIGRDEAAIAEAVRRGACAPYQKEYVRADGARVPVMVFFAFHDPASGAASAFVVDLSGWEATEAALARAHEQMRLAMQAARIFSWDWNVVTGTVQWSPGLEAALGLSEGSFGGTVADFRAMVHPGDAGRVEAAIRQALADERPYDVEFRMLRADGGERWVVARGTVLRDGTGRPTRMIGVDFDITDRKQAELALARNKAALRRIAEAARIVTFEVEDPGAGGEARVSSGFQALHGLPAGSRCDDRRLMDRLHPDDRASVAAELRRLAAEGGHYDVEYRVRLPEGGVRWIQAMGEAEPGLDGMPSRLRGAALDVTARRQAEALLAASEARLRGALDEARARDVAMPVGLVLLDRALRCRHANPAFAAVAGRAAEDHPGRLLAELAPAIWQQLEPALRAVLDRGEAVTGIHLSVRPAASAEERHWLASCHPLRGEAGGVGIALLPLDGERPAAPGPAALQAAPLRHLMDAVDVGAVMVSDLDGIIRFWSGGCERLYGWTAEDALGQAAADLLQAEHPSQLEGIEEALARDGAWSGELRHRTRSGEAIVVAARKALRRGPDGAPVVIEALVDVTPQRRAEAALQDNKATLTAVLDALPVGVAIADAGGRLIRDNQALRDLWGLPPETTSWEGYGDWVAWWPDTGRRIGAEEWAMTRALLRGEVTQDELVECQRFDTGERRFILNNAAPIRDGEGRITGGVVATLDVTARQAARAMLVRANAELEAQVAERTRALHDAAERLRTEMRRREETQAALVQAQKLEVLGQLTGSVAHDFNNVLAAVMGSLRLIGRRTQDNAQVATLVQAGERAAERAAALIRQLMAFARREDIAPVVVRPDHVLEEVDQMLRRAVGTGIRLSIGAPPDAWPVLTDPHRLEVALLNLAMNARDAMQGSGSLAITASNAAPGPGIDRPAGLNPAQDYVRLAVRDSGPGMTPEVLARAAEPFYTTKPRGQGTGLGLAMVDGFACQSGGALRLLSAPGEGTTAEIWLPRAARRAAGPLPDEEAEPDAALHGSAVILLVDDDEQVRLVTAIQLRDLGYEVIEADGMAAAMVQASAAARLDLVVTDITMPGGRGPDLALRLRASRPGMPILFISGYNEPGALLGEVVLAKPFAPAELSRHVLAALGRLPSSAHEGMTMRLSRPELRGAYLAWRALREAAGGDALPGPDDLDSAMLAGAEHAYTVALEEGGQQADGEPRLRFVRIGAALARRLGRPLEGEAAGGALEEDEVFGGLGDAYRRCMRHGVPCHDYARLGFGDGGEPIYFERLLLPLAADGGTRPTHLVGMAFFSDPA